MAKLIERVVGEIEGKRRWRRHRARVRRLPPDHRAAVESLERYAMHFGLIARGDVLVRMLEDLADLFELAAADGTSVRAVVGDDPVQFAETFVANYSEGQWIDRERRRLTDAIDRAAGDA